MRSEAQLTADLIGFIVSIISVSDAGPRFWHKRKSELLKAAMLNLLKRLSTSSLLLISVPSFSRADSLDTWTKQTSGVSQNLYGVAYGTQKYVCVGQAGTILISTNGSAWEPRTSGVTNELTAIAFGNGTFIAVGSAGLILSSADATQWAIQSSGTTNRLNGISRCDGLFVADGNLGTLLTSPDGIVWTAQNSGTTRPLVATSLGNNFFLTVGQGSPYPALLTSSDVANWHDRSAINQGLAFFAVSFGNGVFVAIDVRGMVYTTTNGLNYTRGSATGGGYIYGLTFAQGVFVGVGWPFPNGQQTVATSANGVNWKRRALSITNSANLRAVTYGNGYFVAVGEKGLIIQSGPVATVQLVAINNGAASFILDGEIGRAYRIQASPEMTTSSWPDLLTLTNTAEITPFVDPQPDPAHRFYRAVSQ